MLVIALVFGVTACDPKANVKSGSRTTDGAKASLDAFFAAAAADVAKTSKPGETDKELNSEFSSSVPYLYELNIMPDSKKELLQMLDKFYRANPEYVLTANLSGFSVTNETGFVGGKDIKMSRNGKVSPYDLSLTIGAFTTYYIDGKWYVSNYAK